MSLSLNAHAKARNSASLRNEPNRLALNRIVLHKNKIKNNVCGKTRRNLLEGANIALNDTVISHLMSVHQDAT